MMAWSMAKRSLPVWAALIVLLFPLCVGFGGGQIQVSGSPTGDVVTVSFVVSDTREMANLLAYLVAALASIQTNGQGQYGMPGGAQQGLPPIVMGVTPDGFYGQPGVPGGGQIYQQPGLVPQGPAAPASTPQVAPGAGNVQAPVAGGPFGGSPLGNRTARITSRIGDSRDGGSRRHQGVDLGCPTGTPLYALGSGTVKRVYYSKTGGWTEEIQYDNGYRAMYCHMRDFDTPSGRMAVGTRVQAGQMVGHSNNTGTATTGPHLHFQMNDPSGAIVDPLRVPGIRI
ncbi:MAG: M23 family metallopeptidase [Candidatus Riflebacteria bacterium]|nr:M23 family metallopeptidase [Candidatus Riflebacteria bacterium]